MFCEQWCRTAHNCRTTESTLWRKAHNCRTTESTIHNYTCCGELTISTNKQQSNSWTGAILLSSFQIRESHCSCYSAKFWQVRPPRSLQFVELTKPDGGLDTTRHNTRLSLAEIVFEIKSDLQRRVHLAAQIVRCSKIETVASCSFIISVSE